MNKVAVDIVLLPEKQVTDYAIAANAELVEKDGSRIVLNKGNCLPHISLAMGCIARSDIIRVTKLLEPLAAIIPKKLKLTGIQKSADFSGETVSVLQIECSGKLQKLHESICEAVENFFTYDVTEEMIAGGIAGVSTLRWIANYPAKSSYENFSPHITIGYGDLQDLATPKEFSVSQLALCHLGNNCTCFEVIWSVTV